MSFMVTLTTVSLVSTIPMMFGIFMVLSSSVMLTLLGFLLQTRELELNLDGDVVLCDKGTSCR